MSLPGKHPQGPSADHEPPLALTGEIAPGLDGSGIAHLSCNKSHGGKLGNQIKKNNSQKKSRDDSLRRTEFTPAADTHLQALLNEADHLRAAQARNPT